MCVFILPSVENSIIRSSSLYINRLLPFNMPKAISTLRAVITHFRGSSFKMTHALTLGVEIYLIWWSSHNKEAQATLEF